MPELRELDIMNKGKLIGIIALVAVIGFSMVACGEEDNELVGTWNYSVDNQILFQFVFTNSDYEMKELVQGVGLITGEKGTYSLAGTSITFTPTDVYDAVSGTLKPATAFDQPYVATYSVSGDNLILNLPNQGSLTFKKS
jgi:hypothetical protein